MTTELTYTNSSGSGAIFSGTREHRYCLWRVWNTPAYRKVLFIGLNPSTADEVSNDTEVGF